MQTKDLGDPDTSTGTMESDDYAGTRVFGNFYSFAASEMIYNFPGMFRRPTDVRRQQECVGRSTICPFWYRFRGISTTIGSIFSGSEVHFGAWPSTAMLTFLFELSNRLSYE